MAEKLTKQDIDFMNRVFQGHESPDFNGDHNRKVIENTIAYNDALKKKKWKIYEEQVGERADAVSQYLKSLSNGRTNSDVEKYFGRRELARLRGQKILQTIKDGVVHLEEIN